MKIEKIVGKTYFLTSKSILSHRYADRARKIKNKPIVNRGDAKEEVIRLRRELQEMKMQMLQGPGGIGDMEAKELLDLRETVGRLLKENKELTSALAGK